MSVISILIRAVAYPIVVGLLGIASCRLLKPLNESHMVLVWCNMFTKYLYLPIYPILIFSVVAEAVQMDLLNVYERKFLVASSCALVSCHLWWMYRCEWKRRHVNHKQEFQQLSTAPSRRHLTVFSSNLLMVNPQVNASGNICSEILDTDADVVCVQELSGQWDSAFHKSGVYSRYPFQCKIVREDSFGVGIFAKNRFLRSEIFQLDHEIPVARVTIGNGDSSDDDVEISSIHPLPPRLQEYMSGYRRQMRRIVTEAKQRITASTNGSHRPHPSRAILVGDFNNSPHNQYVFELANCTPPFAAAHDVCGRGSATTFPNGVFPVPPVRLDHCFFTCNTMQCISIREGIGLGSDHRPLIVSFAW